MLLSFKDTQNILTAYQIPFLETFFISSEKELKEIKDFPVVIKTADDVLHKKEVGLVKQNIGNQKELLSHFQKMKRVLIQKQITGFEFFCGMKRDESFGTLLSFGTGGNVELFSDISFGILPLKRNEIIEMMKRTKAYTVIEEKESLIDILLKLSLLAIENPEIKGIDFNPVMQGLVVDAKIVCY